MKTKSRRRLRSTVAAIVAGAALCAGCGYSTTSRTAKDIKTIYVPFFENKTTEPNVEISVTERIIDNLVADNTLKVVRENDADAVLNGQIVEFRNQPFSFNQNLNAQEYVVVIRVVATLFNRRTNEAIWSNRTFEGNGNYFVDPVQNGQTFQDAVNESIREITDRILNITVQDW
jgi:outer membrane lipopolysaccharide assembly protein LptE/RlpB